MTTTRRVITLYEPRWHGFAMWSLELYVYDDAYAVAIVTPLEHGWLRRPKGAEWIQMDESLTVIAS